MTRFVLPPELIEQLRRERSDALKAARAFVNAVQTGDVERLLKAADWIGETVGGWLQAMRGVARLESTTPEIRAAFTDIWIEHKHLPLAVGDRPTMAKAARVLFPCNYTGPTLRLYRGTNRLERRRRLYGFSWTTQCASARKFADQHSEAAAVLTASPRYTEPTALFTGVVLETFASPAAILLMREEEGYYDEGEVVVDPFRLGRVILSQDRGDNRDNA